MATRIKKNVHFLKVLHDARPRVRKILLRTANKELIDTVCECIHNILTGKVKVSPETRKKLSRRRAVIDELHCKSTGVKRKRALLAQQGGFLPALLAPILGIAASVLGGLIK